MSTDRRTLVTLCLIFLIRSLWAAAGSLPLAPVAMHFQEECLTCHGDAAMNESEETKRLYVDAALMAESVHSFLSCTDCHQDLAGVDPIGHDSPLQPVDCGMCHTEPAEQYATSLHAYARRQGNDRAPTCAGCHGAHDILSADDDRAKTNRLNIVGMCATCHSNGGLLTDQLVKMPRAVQTYTQSVHGRALATGNIVAAVCVDCHGVHELKGPLDPSSRINPQNVSKTCGTCHTEVAGEYQRSIHGRALAAGIADSPTCNTCHGEHLILSPQDSRATTNVSHLAAQTCGSCHHDSQISKKYGLAENVLETYVDSYHGWAKSGASEEAATCVDCHTTHFVLPARDPLSSVSPNRVVSTCGRCHENADVDFSQSYTHRTASIAANPITRWIRNIYWILIPLVVGGMLLHNGIILNYFIMEKRRAEASVPQVLRLDRTQIVQHVLLAVSFIGLVITGFALRFPNAWWVAPLSAVGMTEASRSVIHRFLALMMLGAGISHVFYIAGSKRGRREFKGLIPEMRDITDFFQTMALHTWMRREAVKFHRYDYTQKVEYWALVWGTLLMAVSGFVLWFPAQAVKIFPTWIVQAAEAVHYFEAWLAALAILVWHFFFTIFHPRAFPMSWTWLTGKMTREEVRHHHGRWFEEEVRDAPDPKREERSGPE